MEWIFEKIKPWVTPDKVNEWGNDNAIWRQVKMSINDKMFNTNTYTNTTTHTYSYTHKHTHSYKTKVSKLKENRMKWTFIKGYES